MTAGPGLRPLTPVAALGSQLKRRAAKAAARPQAASTSRSLVESALANDVWMKPACARCPRALARLPWAWFVTP